MEGRKSVMTWVLLSLIFLFWGNVALAVATKINVYVKNKDAKFLGDEVGGAAVEIYDFQTGKLLAQGVTKGKTGDTAFIMETPRTSRETMVDEHTARFSTTLDIDRPLWVRVVAKGPLAYPNAFQTASISQWVMPGKHLDKESGIILEIPGLIVDLIRPQFIPGFSDEPAKLHVQVKVALLCGCPVTPQGLWDSNKMELKAHFSHESGEKATLPLKYEESGEIFTATLIGAKKGTYSIEVSGYDPTSGNAGHEKMTFTIMR